MVPLMDKTKTTSNHNTPHSDDGATTAGGDDGPLGEGEGEEEESRVEESELTMEACLAEFVSYQTVSASEGAFHKEGAWVIECVYMCVYIYNLSFNNIPHKKQHNTPPKKTKQHRVLALRQVPDLPPRAPRRERQDGMYIYVYIILYYII